jgi:predicted RNase H-like nuclease
MNSSSQDVWVAGADGCPMGWLVVFRSLAGHSPRAQICQTFAEVVAMRPARIAVDIPIGLPAVSERGGRKADREARMLLGKSRGSSVFPAPSRATLNATSFPGACELELKNSKPPKRISKQTYNILCKIRDVDRIARDTQCLVFECHPEVSFHVMNGKDLQFSKRRAAGLNERRALLAREGYCENFLKTKIGQPGDHSLDDLVDACVAAWTAERLFENAIRFPKTPDFDSHCLDMAIWA